MFLLLFYPFTFDRRLEKMEQDENAVQGILKEYENIRLRLEKLNQEGFLRLESMHIIMDMINHVAQLRCRNLGAIREGVREIMAGTLLYSEAFKVGEEGRAEGRAEGRKEGKAEGRFDGKLEMLKDLVKMGFVPEADAARMEEEIRRSAAIALAEEGTGYQAE